MLEKTKLKLSNLYDYQSKNYLLAVSGGVDSMVLISIFQELELNFGVAHCNFQLRELEADLDTKLVEETTSDLNKKFYKVYFETKKYASENGISTQMAARDLRYNWFDEVATKNNYDYIVTAHHLNDQVETILLNLTRGTGIDGITGIKFLNKNIIRPLLSISKQEILAFAEKENVEYRNDKSNLSNKYKRNSIRNQVIPLLEELNPSFLKTMEKNIENFNSVAEIYNKSIEKELSNSLITTENENFYINIEQLKSVSNSTNLLYEFIKKHGFNYSDSEQLIKSISDTYKSGKLFYSTTHSLLIDRKNLILSPIKEMINEEFFISKENKIVTFPIKLTLKKLKKEELEIIANKNVAFFDYNFLQFPLLIRKWKPGDYFYPFGGHGRKKLSDYFIDNKFSLLEKKETYVLVSANEIIWVIGHRSSERHKISSKTSQILEIKLG